MGSASLAASGVTETKTVRTGVTRRAAVTVSVSPVSPAPRASLFGWLFLWGNEQDFLTDDSRFPGHPFLLVNMEYLSGTDWKLLPKARGEATRSDSVESSRESPVKRKLQCVACN